MALTVVLIRHAKPTFRSNTHDFVQPLSPEGEKIQHKMDLYLRQCLVIPHLLWHSPLLRTKQTAQIIAQDFQVPALEEPALGQDFDQQALLGKLLHLNIPQAGRTVIFLVGHAPSLMSLASFLTGESIFSIHPAYSSALSLRFDSIPYAGGAHFERYYAPEDVLTR